TSEAFNAKQRSKHILEHFHPRLEPFEDQMCDTGIGIGTPFKHPAPDLLFRLNGRQIRKRQIMLAFKVDPFVHELLAALIVDHASDQMRETSLTRVTRRSRPDEIRMNHPAASKPKDGVEPSGERVHLCMCGRVHVWAA